MNTQTMSKENIKQWRRQLIIRPLLKSDKQEALALFYKSHSQTNLIHIAIGMTEEEFYASEGKFFEQDHIYEKSYALVDPSNNNKLLSFIAVRDMSKVKIAPPSRETTPCPKEFLKLQLFYDLWKPLENIKFQYNEAETTSIVTDPDCANLGLTQMIQAIYMKDMYIRNVSYQYNLIYNMISYRMLTKVKSLNTTALNFTPITEYELNGEKIFKDNKDGGVLLRCEITEQAVIDYGWGDFVRKTKMRKQIEQRRNQQILNQNNDSDNNNQIRPSL